MDVGLDFVFDVGDEGGVLVRVLVGVLERFGLEGGRGEEEGGIELVVLVEGGVLGSYFL